MKTQTIGIRRAEPRDAGDIADVHQLAWSGAYSGIIPHKALNTMLQRRGKEWWSNAIRRATSVLVVEMDGVIAGYATYGRNRVSDLAEQGEIYELYVRPEYQGIGLGTRLFAAAQEALARHDLKGLVVWALEENNTATAFYEGLGGRDVAEGVEVFDAKALRKVAYTWN